MLISKAHATMSEASEEILDLAGAPSPMESFMWNIGMVIILVGLFYVLLIMPQQRRFKEHSEMLSGLKKGDRVVTGGGLIGKIEKVVDDKEVLLDLGNGVKVTALRSMIQNKADLELKAPANDSKSKKTSGKKDKEDTKDVSKEKSKSGKTKTAKKPSKKDNSKKDTGKA